MKNVKPVALVALAFGLLAAPLVQAQDAPPPPGMEEGPGGPGGMRSADRFDGMSVEGKKLLANDMIDGREKSKGFREARQAAREKVRAAMLAEPFNANALRDAFEAERKLASDQMKQHHEQMAATIAKLSPADRKIFAQGMGRMEDRMKRGGERWKERRGDGPSQ